jgi:hypothetical protein
MNIAYEITMPASNKTENVAQYLIMQRQHKHSRFSRKRLCMHDAFAGIFTNSGFDLYRVWPTLWWRQMRNTVRCFLSPLNSEQVFIVSSTVFGSVKGKMWRVINQNDDTPGVSY